ncbi:MAG: AAA family ATPase [Catenulispora sp.]|nr:AAA family ATPase [Catenulispora sp.]
MICGAPGVGKTTLARPLAQALDLPLFAKDSIKERLHDTLADTEPAGSDPVEQQWSRRLGAASMELLWLLAAEAPACVLEANFWRGHEQQNAALRTLNESGTLIELYCTAPREEILRRFHTRQATGDRHTVHPDLAFESGEWERKFGKPIGIGHVVEVDTTTPVDVEALAATIRSLWEAAG